MVPITMFRLAHAPVRHVQSLLATTLPRITAVSATTPAASLGRRTYKPKVKSNNKSGYGPDPSAKAQARKAAMGKPQNRIEIHRRPFTEFRQRHELLNLKHVTPEESYEIYCSYLDVFTSSRRTEDPEWNERFIRTHDVTADSIHEVACFLFSLPDMTSAEWHLFCYMLNSAATLGYDPAALSLGRVLLDMNHSSTSLFHYDNPTWKEARARCDALIKEGKNANALVVGGLFHMNRNTKNDNYLALDYFSKAAERLGDPVFDWPVVCFVKMGEACLRLGEKENAKRAYRRLAGAGYAEGYYHMALMEPDNKRYLDWMTKAASSGVREAYEPLMNKHIECSKDCELAGDEEDATTHRLLAEEWGKLLKYWKTKKV